MNIQSLKPELEDALFAKFTELAKEYRSRVMRRVDIGVFPWHGAIELSVLFVDDDCDENDIAYWPHFNVSQLGEGKWPEAQKSCKDMQHLWEVNPSLSHAFFQLVAEAVKSQKVQSSIESIVKSESFALSLFDPDNKKSESYCLTHHSSGTPNGAP